MAWNTATVHGRVGYAFDPRTGTTLESVLVYVVTVALFIVNFGHALGVQGLPIVNDPALQTTLNVFGAWYVNHHGTP